jgi:NAD(P)-dependent dehydrogenase (short-subunit alcohol dehydrogenase family)
LPDIVSGIAGRWARPIKAVILREHSMSDSNSNDSPKLNGKIAVVTGGNSGIGLATSRFFITEGAARVYLTGRRQPELEAAAAYLGPKAVPVQGDVSDPTDLDRLYDLVRTQVGHVDIVFANAGVATLATLGSLSEADVDQMLNINIKGVIWTVQKALPLMGPGGSIILNASIAASKGFPDWSVYSATKAAVRSFARTWSSDLKGRGIRVNAVSPGFIETSAQEKIGLISSDRRNAFFSWAASITPLERIGRADEVAKVVTFLASEESGFVAGSEIFVDGGVAQV